MKKGEVMSEDWFSSRRDALKSLVGCCRGGMMGHGMTGRARSHGGGGKSSKAAANYRDSPKGGENCAYFQAPRGSAVVSGSVRANGWRRLWRG
jgi:hypothetical protein